jgi:AraC-like DNA-binding protein
VTAAVVESAAAGGTAMLTRSYDQLRIARFRAGSWLFPEPNAADRQAWPYVAVYVRDGRASALHGSSRTSAAARELLILRNTSRLVISASMDADVALILIPAGAVGPYSHVLGTCAGQCWSASEGTAGLVGHLLDGLVAQLAAYTPLHPARLAQHIVGLMALMCSEWGPPEALPAHSHRLLEQAKEYIELNLADISLTPDLVAAALHVSTRTLHRLFESDGHTISGWIRLRRLEHCRAELADLVSDTSPVSSIGAKWGLWDAAHFSRLFKSSYGMPPRAYRDAQRSGQQMTRSSILLELVPDRG